MSERGYTHEDYRRAKVIQLRNKKDNYIKVK